ncbi:MAG: hypothetical protein H6937_10510 [Burkholderiales bacterium]|nr:hypothetical protein [Burkholderiales bacterium]MDR4518647.1 hypothetical protein [Nitrosomonas sp.]
MPFSRIQQLLPVVAKHTTTNLDVEIIFFQAVVALSKAMIVSIQSVKNHQRIAVRQ